MSKEELIQRKGAIEIVFEMSHGPRQFSHLKDEIRISPTTISKRLKEGEDEGLWKEELLHQEDDKFRAYVLQDPGMELLELLQQEELPHLIKERRRLEDEFERKVENVLEWVD